MKHMLVVDDDPLVAATLQAALTGSGYRVLLTRSHEQALNEVRSEAWDILIADLSPNEGVALCKAVRGAHPHLVIVALSGGDYPEDLVGHCDSLLRKPVDARRLIDTLEQLEFGKVLNNLDPSAQALRW